MEGDASSLHSTCTPAANTAPCQREPPASAADAPGSKIQPSEAPSDEADTPVAKASSSSALKPVLDTFETYLADKRTVQMKRQLSTGIFQVVSELCSGLGEGDKDQMRGICDALLANQMKGLHLLYQFLGEIFRG